MNEYRLKGYVARDKNCELHLGNEKPSRNNYFGVWQDFGVIPMKLPFILFPELKWTDEPIKVELTIKKV